MPENPLMRAAYGVYPQMQPRRPNVAPRDASEDVAGLAELGLSIAPGSGEAMSAHDAWDASGRAGNALLRGEYGEAAGQYGNMLTGVLGAIPGVGIVARGTKRGAAWMDRNLPAGVNRLLDYITPSDPKNTTFTFAGPNAKTADQNALTKAQDLAGSGASRDEIWDQTGWFQGADGKWRFEIDDSSAKPFMMTEMQLKKQPNLEERFRHPDLYAAYPDAASVKLRNDYANPNYLGLYDPKDDSIALSAMRLTSRNDKAALKSTTLHELQHSIQGREGFAVGANLDTYKLNPEGGMRQAAEFEDAHLVRSIAEQKHMSPQEAARWIESNYGRAPQGRAVEIAEMHPVSKIEEMQNRIKELMEYARDPSGSYRRTAGEVEARNVQARMNMTPEERRAQAPWLTQDIPDDKQIVRFR